MVLPKKLEATQVEHVPTVCQNRHFRDFLQTYWAIGIVEVPHSSCAITTPFTGHPRSCIPVAGTQKVSKLLTQNSLNASTSVVAKLPVDIDAQGAPKGGGYGEKNDHFVSNTIYGVIIFDGHIGAQ